MACVDLSKIDRVVTEMDTFFPPINESVSEAQFAKLSRIRAASSGFGKSVRAVGVDGYDLVDLTDLITRYGGEESPVMAALGDAVIYSRSKNTKSGGLSVYHPYENKKKYLESWRDDYRLLNFSGEYIRYLEHFGAFLTGESYVDWSGLSPMYGTIAENGEHLIRLQLTEAQAADYLSGEMQIMADFSRTKGQYSLAPISSSPVSIDENGVLTAGYSGRALYAVDANGKILQGPVSFTMSDDGEYYVILAVYRDYSARADNRKDTAVLHYCKADPRTGDIRIVRSYVYDDATQTYTNRIAFSPDGFTDLEFRYFIRDMPDPKKPIPGFNDWSLYNGYWARVLKLPCDWHLRFVDDWSNDSMFAVFQITDTRQDHWSSLPLRISSPREKQAELTLSMPETEGIEITCSTTIRTTTLYPAVQIGIDIRNDTDKTLTFSGSALVLNGSRTVNEDFRLYDVEAGKTGNDSCTLTADDLTGLNRIQSVDFTLSMSISGDYETEPVLIPVHLELENGELGLLSSDVPESLDEYADGDIVWQLVSMQQEENGDLTGMIHVQNAGDTAIEASYKLMVNGMQTGTHFTVHLEPGTDAYYSFKDENRDVLTRISLSVTGNDRPYVLGVSQALQQAGILVADRVDIYPDQEEPYRSGEVRGISLRIPDGIALQEPEAAPEQAELLNSDGILVTLDQVLIADNGIGLGLRLENDTDKAICLKILDPEMNGIAYDNLFFSTTVLMPPHTRAVRCISLRDRDEFTPGMQVDTMSFVFQIGNCRTDPVVLHFSDHTLLGAHGGIMLAGANISITKATLEDKPMAFNETPAVSALPFHPFSVTAPMTPEEAERLEHGGAYLCILTREKSREPDSPEYLTHRDISGTSLEKTGDAWTAMLSGIAVMAEDHYLTTDETRLSNNIWQLKPSKIYFYPEAGSCQPTGEGLWMDGFSLQSNGGIFLTVDPAMRAEIADGQVTVSDFQAKLSEWGSNLSYDDRTNRYLDEIAEAATETRVFFGTDRLTNYRTIDFYESFMLSLKEPVTLTLIPAETLEGDKCLYYALFFTDGSRKDILQDPETGEILEETFTPAE